MRNILNGHSSTRRKREIPTRNLRALSSSESYDARRAAYDAQRSVLVMLRDRRTSSSSTFSTNHQCSCLTRCGCSYVRRQTFFKSISCSLAAAASCTFIVFSAIIQNWIVRLTHVYLNFWGNFTDKINVNENKRDVSQTISEMCCCCHLPTDMHNIPLNFFGANGGGGSNSGGGNDSHNVFYSTIWMQNIRKKICNDHNNARTKKLHAHTFMSG